MGWWVGGLVGWWVVGGGWWAGGCTYKFNRSMDRQAILQHCVAKGFSWLT